ncbi:MAG TPA: phosphatase PAP2 family protein [Gammaproteobacteria bacterium]|nr:phosphatase PAP2 family protein [Gammaproteobacteria bacterium]
MPAAFFALTFAGIALAQADFRLANAFFYDGPAHAWIGAHAWWANALIHKGGRDLVASIAVTALLVYLASFGWPRWRQARGGAGYVVIAIALGTGLVGLLKQVTHMDCPWSLTNFGGTHAFVGLFAFRPSGAAHAACFPGAHSSAGFALMCFYFVFRERAPRAARAFLAAGALLGCVFAFGQEARGAHFLSHDVASAAVVWFAQLAAYAFWMRRTAAPPRAAGRERRGYFLNNESSADRAACSADCAAPSNALGVGLK